MANFLFKNKKNLPVDVVRNGISRERFEKLKFIPDLRNKEKKEILYVGNVGLAQNLRTLVNAAVSFPDVLFKIVGQGSDLDEIRRYVMDKGANNVELVGGVQWEELKKYYAKANILYAQIMPEYESAIPSKLYEYGSLGKPVIFGGVGASVRFLNQFSGFQVVTPGDTDQLIKAIQNSLCQDFFPQNQENILYIEKYYIREPQVESVSSRIFSLSKHSFSKRGR